MVNSQTGLCIHSLIRGVTDLNCCKGEQEGRLCEHFMLPSVFAGLLCACVTAGSAAVLNVLAHNGKQVTIQASCVVCRVGFYVSGFSSGSLLL